MKTAVIVGRFQPISIAHKNIIQESVDKYDQTYVVVVNSLKSIIAGTRKRLRAQGISMSEDDSEFWSRKLGKLTPSKVQKLEDEKERNPFSGMMRKKLIYESFGGKLHQSRIISHMDGNIEQIINKIHNIDEKTKEFVVICGKEREKAYKRQIDGGFEKEYFNPGIKTVELDVIERDIDAADNISATRIREALKENNFERFKLLTPAGIHNKFGKMQQILTQDIKNIPFFQKMLLEMVHIEDLKVADFINFIKNIYSSEASVKLDGTTALSFGLDDEGRFYTGLGRDFKKVDPSWRMYNAEDWLKRRNIFINPAVSAHTFLEKHVDTIRKHLKPGDNVLAEVLFGDKPNCIKYNFSGINYLVILDNDDLADALKTRKSNVDTVNYVLEVDSIIPKAVKQVWKFGKTQRVDPSKYEIDVEKELLELENFLESKTGNKRNIDIIGMRAAGKDKDLVKKVREKAENLKLNIKEKLLVQFVRKIHEGDYIPSEGYSHEGIVLKLGDERVKIIDKEVFTANHNRDWEPINVVKKIRKTMTREEAIRELTRMIDGFDTLYPKVSDDMKARMKNSLRMTRLTLQEQ